MFCWGCQEDVSHVDFCQKCGRLQPASNAEEDFFQVLGFTPSLALDTGGLEESFHAKSREFHPDRFQQKEDRELEISLERSAALNEAYRTLKDSRKRAEYVVQTYGEPQAESNEVPKELAELYFDLQDLDSDSIQLERFEEFSKALKEKDERMKGDLQRLSSSWDQEVEKEQRKSLLESVRGVLHDLKYLESMQRDLQARIEKGTK